MARYRVKAFFMHKAEAAAAKEAARDATITEAEWADGYVIGVIDEKHVGRLVKQGLVITPIEKVEAKRGAGRPGKTGRVRSGGRVHGAADRAAGPAAAATVRGERVLDTAISGRTDVEKIVSRNRLAPAFYVVRLNGPVTDERALALEQQKIRLLECLGGDSHTVRLGPVEVTTLAALPFVDRIRLYTRADTVGATDTGVKKITVRYGAQTGRPERFTRLFAVRTHDPADLPAVTQWLESRGRKPFKSHDDMLRVALVQGGADYSALASLPEVAAVEEILPIQTYDRNARQTLRLERPGKPAFGYEGEGQIIGIADTGLDDEHGDYKPRIVEIRSLGRVDDHSDPDGHGTHVVGCAVGDGSGSNGEVRGAAPKAKLFFQSILDANGGLGGLPSNLGDLFDAAYKEGVRIHNNSWGAFAYAQYSSTSRDVDRFVAEHPDMLIVIAAGNDAIATPRAEGGTINAKPGYVDWPSVAAPATAKNGLSVGASRNSRRKGGYAALTWADAWGERYPKPPIGRERISGNIECLAAFSGRGPCDQRIKPDVVAPGTDIAAARSRHAPLFKFWGAYPNNPQYAFMGGTSMAAPYVAGCAALVREYFVETEKWTTPSAALLKATLINGTKRMTGKDAVAFQKQEPNYHQGFGRIDMAATIPNPLFPGLKLAFVDTWKDEKRKLRSSAQSLRYRIEAGGKAPLRFCLAWTDPPGRGLENQMFLLVDLDGKKFPGNSGAITTNVLISNFTSDPNNNVQIVRIKKPKAGTYAIQISATQLRYPGQAIALVVTGDLRSPLSPET